jgi:hypothetical protein
MSNLKTVDSFGDPTELFDERGRLYSRYRRCCFFQKYTGYRLNTFRKINVAMDLIIALATSSSLAGLAIFHTQLGENTMTLLLALSVVISIVRPVLKVSEQIDKYFKLHYGYAGLFLNFEDLMSENRGVNSGAIYLKQLARTNDRYEALAREVPPVLKQSLANRCWNEVNSELPRVL